MTTFPHVATFVCCVFFFLYADEVYGYTITEIKSWCNQTPHPDTCENVLADQPNIGSMKQKPDFIKALIKVTLERATDAESNTKGLGPKCGNNLEKDAWNDCVQLYAYTVERINKTVDPHKKCSQVEIQTWLSAALTNIDTCKTGFVERGVGSSLLPLMNNNVSFLLSNTLAMNSGGPSMSYEPTYELDFPTWVKPGDRKLLQSADPASGTNAVVAQDGSGTHKTIASALASAKSGGGRYVIYVKAGTYNEYIDVRTNNIVIRGDGIGKTVCWPRLQDL